MKGIELGRGIFINVAIRQVLDNYDFGNLTIATLCSHTSLQIFYGARKEGFKTLGIAVGTVPKFYDAYPKAKPDDFFVIEQYR